MSDSSSMISGNDTSALEGDIDAVTIEQQKMSPDIQNYIAELGAKLGAQKPFVKDITADSRHIKLELSKAWPVLPGKQKQATNLRKIIEDEILSDPVVKVSPMIMVRIVIGKSEISATALPDPNQSGIIVSFNVVEGILRRYMVPPSDKAQASEEMGVPSGLVVTCQSMGVLFNPLSDNRKLGMGAGNLYTERTRDITVGKNDPNDMQPITTSPAAVYDYPQHAPPAENTSGLERTIEAVAAIEGIKKLEEHRKEEERRQKEAREGELSKAEMAGITAFAEEKAKAEREVTASGEDGNGSAPLEVPARPENGSLDNAESSISQQEREQWEGTTEMERRSLEGITEQEREAREGTTEMEREAEDGIQFQDQQEQDGITEQEQRAQEGIAEQEQEAQNGIEEQEQRAQEGIAEQEQQAQEGITEQEQEAQNGIAEQERRAQEGIAEQEEQAEEGSTDMESTAQQSATEMESRVQEGSTEIERQAQEASTELEQRGQESATEMESRAQEGSTEIERQAQEASTELEQRGQESSTEMESRAQEGSTEIKRQAQEASTELEQRGHENSTEIEHQAQESSPEIKHQAQENSNQVETHNQQASTEVEHRGQEPTHNEQSEQPQQESGNTHIESHSSENTSSHELHQQETSHAEPGHETENQANESQTEIHPHEEPSSNDVHQDGHVETQRNEGHLRQETVSHEQTQHVHDQTADNSHEVHIPEEHGSQQPSQGRHSPSETRHDVSQSRQEASSHEQSHQTHDQTSHNAHEVHVPEQHGSQQPSQGRHSPSETRHDVGQSRQEASSHAQPHQTHDQASHTAHEVHVPEQHGSQQPSQGRHSPSETRQDIRQSRENLQSHNALHPSNGQTRDNVASHVHETQKPRMQQQTHSPDASRSSAAKTTRGARDQTKVGQGRRSSTTVNNKTKTLAATPMRTDALRNQNAPQPSVNGKGTKLSEKKLVGSPTPRRSASTKKLSGRVVAPRLTTKTALLHGTKLSSPALSANVPGVTSPVGIAGPKYMGVKIAADKAQVIAQTRRKRQTAYKGIQQKLKSNTIQTKSTVKQALQTAPSISQNGLQKLVPD